MEEPKAEKFLDDIDQMQEAEEALEEERRLDRSKTPDFLSPSPQAPLPPAFLSQHKRVGRACTGSHCGLPVATSNPSAPPARY